MKKFLLLMLPVMALCLASCERWMDDSPIIQFKDPYFLEAALNGGCDGDGYSTGETKVDKNGDGQISEKEASVVKGLYLSLGERIRNLDEIKYFTALTYLDCGSNQLTSLDLSNNTALTNLYCSNNPLQKLILYKYHLVEYDMMSDIELEYGDIIEYVD